MWSDENQRSSEFSVSSFGMAVPQLVKGSRLSDAGADANHDVNCGLLGIYPSVLQSYRTPRCYLFFLCILGMTQGFVVNGLVSVVTPTIEKRFQLLGIEVGLIQSMFNVASCIMVTPVSYHGGVAHKPVILGIGALVMSAGAMVFASPHFIAAPYLIVDSGGSANVCPERGPGECSRAGKSTNANAFKYFFMLGHAMHGVGSSPFFTLGVAYLDQNVPTSSSSIYMGIFYATSVLGPAMGFLLGGYFLSKYTDITVDSSQLGMDSSSTNWVGAWWLGFFGASIVMFLAAFPVASFPRALPTAKLKALEAAEKEKEKQQSKQSPDAQDSKAEEEPKDAQEPKDDTQEPRDASRQQQDALEPKDVRSPQTNVGPTPERSFGGHVKRLVRNPTFVCLTLAAAAETMLASGLTGFATKIFISMFGISSSQASGLLGAVAVPSACGGTLLGGYVITKLNVKSSTIVRYCVILSLVPWFTLFVFNLSCSNNHSALVNRTSDQDTLTFRDLERDCNSHCNCTGVMFDPICGSDNFTYYSPCVAGCTDEKRFEKTRFFGTMRGPHAQLYTQCTCVNGPLLHKQLENDSLFYYMAKRDPCVSDCSLVFVYAGAIFVALFFTFLLIVPALTALLRSVDEDIKSTGIGVNYVAIRLLGTIPGPIVFGHLIDRSCVLWRGTCSGGSGACAMYENAAMGMNLFRVMISVKTASILFFFCASLSTCDWGTSFSSPGAESVPAEIVSGDGDADKKELPEEEQLQNLGASGDAAEDNFDKRKEHNREIGSKEDV